ncbi:MAG: DUF5681 domain-containing protein [Endomicrobium sp.]|jgi:hypothetical protein|nr:DUF5681 domain-containing protein [Endomicrobium sp.]
MKSTIKCKHTKVGYKNPPKHSQFKKGSSGNPYGRPKGDKNFATIFGEALNEKITVKQKNGKEKIITKKQAIATQLTNKAVTGDQKAAGMVIAQANIVESKEAEKMSKLTASKEMDTFIINDFAKRIKDKSHE